MTQLTEKAKEQTMAKLGPKMIQQVDQEFNDVIFPTIKLPSIDIIRK